MIKQFKTAYNRFIRIRGTPHEIAQGFALGLFIGLTPSMGFQMALAVFVAAILKWNKISSAIGVWITNPLTAPFVYAFTYKVGTWVIPPSQAYCIPKDSGFEILMWMLKKAPEMFWILTVGGVVAGIPVAILGYLFAYRIILKSREEVQKLKYIHELKREVRDSRDHVARDNPEKKE